MKTKKIELIFDESYTKPYEFIFENKPVAIEKYAKKTLDGGLKARFITYKANKRIILDIFECSIEDATYFAKVRFALNLEIKAK